MDEYEIVENQEYNDLKAHSKIELVKNMLIVMYFLEVEKKDLLMWDEIEKSDLPEGTYLHHCFCSDPDMWDFMVKLKTKFEKII